MVLEDFLQDNLELPTCYHAVFLPMNSLACSVIRAFPIAYSTETDAINCTSAAFQYVEHL
jgi:hypothetical protein